MKGKGRFQTRAVQQAREHERNLGAVVAPMHLSTTYKYAAPGAPLGEYDYTRSGNPNRNEWEGVLSEMEGAEHGIAFASGMAASTSLLWLLRPGDHAIVTRGCYGGTFRLFNVVAREYGIEPSFVDTSDLSALEAAFRPNTRLLLIETPTNPFLRLTDLAGAAALARERNVVTAVDNTFLSPYYQRPLEHGIDIVFHSATKYLGGHSDILSGVVAVSDADLAERLRFMQYACGAVPSPHDCWLLLRSVKTLDVRMRQHSRNALAVARALSEHPAVDEVFYPGLESHPQHELAKRQQIDPQGQPGYGGMVSLLLKDAGVVEALGRRTEVFALAESLGGVESLLNHPATMTHASMPDADRLAMGITDKVLRLSVGIEAAEDLVEDITAALS